MAKETTTNESCGKVESTLWKVANERASERMVKAVNEIRLGEIAVGVLLRKGPRVIVGKTFLGGKKNRCNGSRRHPWGAREKSSLKEIFLRTTVYDRKRERKRENSVSFSFSSLKAAALWHGGIFSFSSNRAFLPDIALLSVLPYRWRQEGCLVRPVTYVSTLLSNSANKQEWAFSTSISLL